MTNSKILNDKKTYFAVAIILGLIALIFSVIFSLPNGKLLVVFCDVGQGDAIYIKTPKGADILVDAGPSGAVLNCLSKHTPFWDREIELAFLTHPQADHLNGFLGVLQRYTVKSFGIGVEGNETEGYKKLLELLKNNNIKVFNPYLGQKISFDDGIDFDILWPYYDWVYKQVEQGPPLLKASPFAKASEDKSAGQGAVLGASTKTELNSFSTVLLLRYKDFEVLLTGDADAKIQDEILKNNNLGEVEVLKVPHHGSKTALLGDFLEAVKPKTAVISVGKNSYGHPNGELIERLKKVGASVKRTDEGEVVVESGGGEYRIMN